MAKVDLDLALEPLTLCRTHPLARVAGPNPGIPRPRARAKDGVERPRCRKEELPNFGAFSQQKAEEFNISTTLGYLGRFAQLCGHWADQLYPTHFLRSPSTPRNAFVIF